MGHIFRAMVILLAVGCAGPSNPEHCDSGETGSETDGSRPSLDAGGRDAQVRDAGDGEAEPSDGGEADAALLVDGGEVDAALPDDAIRIGWSRVDLTPPLEPPVQLRGGRIATGVLDPITATALALESPGASAILISADLLWIPDGRRGSPDLVGAVRRRVVERVPELDGSEVVLMATHTHAAPRIHPGVVDDYADAIAAGAVRAWEGRDRGAVSFGLGHAVAGHNRIVTHEDGSSRMVGSLQMGRVSHPDFRHLESFEDHSVHLLYTFDASRRLTGVVVNVSCPAQVQRGEAMSADFWHEVRELLGERLGPSVALLPQVSAAGEISTVVMVERDAEARMAALRHPELRDSRALRRRQIAERMVATILDVLPVVRSEMSPRPPLAHRSREVALPGGCPMPDGSTYEVELHALRIDGIVMVANPFELYLDYGLRIKGRSPAIQTFVVELAGSGSYLPTHRAIPGGGYGSRPSECEVGPVAGDMLVTESLALIEEVWSLGSSEPTM